jgi:fucose permease
MPAPISKSRLIPAAILAIFVYGLIAAMLGTLLPELSRKYGLTPDQNGGIALAQAIGLIIASLAVGPLIDNRGKKTGLLLGLGLIAASLFVVPNSPAGGLKIVFLALGARRRHHRHRGQRPGQRYQSRTAALPRSTY